METKRMTNDLNDASICNNLELIDDQEALNKRILNSGKINWNLSGYAIFQQMANLGYKRNEPEMYCIRSDGHVTVGKINLEVAKFGPANYVEVVKCDFNLDVSQTVGGWNWTIEQNQDISRQESRSKFNFERLIKRNFYSKINNTFILK